MGRPGVPVYQLLGGKLRDTIPTKMMIGRLRFGAGQVARRTVSGLGRACLKVKVGLDLAGDLARVRAVAKSPGRMSH